MMNSFDKLIFRFHFPTYEEPPFLENVQEDVSWKIR